MILKNMVDWYSETTRALVDLWQNFVIFVPRLIGALIVFIIGWFIAVGIGKLITEILNRIKFNQLFETSGWKKALEKAELKTGVSEFIGTIVRWVLIIVVLQVAVGMLGWVSFKDVLDRVVGYLPNVVIAALIFVVAMVITDIVVKIIVAATEGAKFIYSHLAGEIVRWSIWIFAILIILHQLKVAPQLIETLFTGLVAVLVISLGLAFGLGGKEIAFEILQDLKRRLKG